MNHIQKSHLMSALGHTLSAICLIGTLLLSGCSTHPMDTDGVPRKRFDVSHLPDAKPKVEPKSRGGNKSYTVFRKRYHVLSSSKNFRQQGVASWYGRKWHGRKTANGETYNMYAMTAAHKHLPLPTYAKVTNLENGKAVVVRINDRGPFAGNRIIDLSYSAAAKLGVVNRGLARVEVEAIDPSQTKRQIMQATPKKNAPKAFPRPGKRQYRSTPAASQVVKAKTKVKLKKRTQMKKPKH